MGCQGSKKLSVDQRFKRGLADVKINLKVQLSDTEMVREILNTLVTYVNFLHNEDKFEDFFGKSFAGLHLLSTLQLSATAGRSLHQLVRPDHLTHRTQDNFLSFKHVFAEITAAADEINKNLEAQEMGHDGDAMGDLDGGDSGIEDDGEGSSDQGSEAWGAVEESADKVRYETHKRSMLDVLVPLCDMIDGILAVIKKGQFVDGEELSEKYLEEMKNKMGLVAAIVKVFEPPSQGQQPARLQIPAFIGPESYGKSSLINRIIARGEDKEIMPASPGMGTEVVCKIASGIPESCCLASDTKGLKVSNINEVLDKLNKSLKKKKSNGEVLGIKDMDMLLARVPFDTRGAHVEFLDVPGIKKATVFHTVVALGLATCLVLVCGKLQDLSTQLQSGDLMPLKEIFKKLRPPIPIQPVASFHVNEKDIMTQKDQYRALIQKAFSDVPGVEVREPLWMNFFDAGLKNPTKIEETLDKFYDSVTNGAEKTTDPYEKFLSLENDIEGFTIKLSEWWKKALRKYLSEDMANVKDHMLGKIHELSSGKELSTLVKEGFAPQDSPVNEFEPFTQDIVDLPSFQVLVGQETLDQVQNVALIGQHMLNEIRLAEIGFLTQTATAVHDDGIGQILGSLSDLTARGLKDTNAFPKRVSEAFRFFTPEAEADATDEKAAEEHAQIWKSCSHLAAYMNPSYFGWFVTGFYLSSHDKRNRYEFLKYINTSAQNRQAVESGKNTWEENLRKTLSKVPYKEWVSRVNVKKNNQKEALEEVCDCMKDACNLFTQIAKSSGFLSKGTSNRALEELMEVCFVLIERLFVKQSDKNITEPDFTGFAKYLQKSANPTAELKDRVQGVIAAEAGRASLDACAEAVTLMKRSANLSTKWQAKLTHSMPRDVTAMSRLSDMTTLSFTRREKDIAVLLISKGARDTLTPGAFWGAPATSASEALTCLDNAGRQGSELAGNVPAHTVDEDSFPRYALDTVNKVGARVGVYMRRSDSASYDPLDRERNLLEQLGRQPQLVKLFVLWTPTLEDKPWSGEYQKNWETASGPYLDIELITVTPKTKGVFDCQYFIKEKVKRTLDGSKVKADETMGNIQVSMNNLKESLVNDMNSYTSDVDSTRKVKPLELHHFIAHDARIQKKRALKNVKADKPKFPTPSKKHLCRMFVVSTTDVVETAGGGEENAYTINELKARTFLLNAMLGEVVAKASLLASEAHDKVIAKLLDFIGEKGFFMSGEEIQRKLQVYLDQSGPGDETMKKELKHLGLLNSILKKDCFQHMYCGSVTYMLMPAVHATVMPLLWSLESGAAIESSYRNALLRSDAQLKGQDLTAAMSHNLSKGTSAFKDFNEWIRV